MARENTARHWIDGEWVDSDRACDSINPATGEVIGTYADADAKVGQRAIDAAGRAFVEGGWRLDPMVRATALSHLADAYAARGTSSCSHHPAEPGVCPMQFEELSLDAAEDAASYPTLAEAAALRGTELKRWAN